MSYMAGPTRRELENTRVDLRRWAEQLRQVAGEVSERADEIENQQGGKSDEPGRDSQADR